MSKAFTRWSMLLAAAGVLAGCASNPAPTGQLDDAGIARLASIGSRDFGIQWQRPPSGAVERGVMAVTDGTTTLTTRGTSRIYIVHNRKTFPPTEVSAFQGTDDQLKSIGRKLLAATGANEREIGEEKVLQQFVQVGQSDANGKDVVVSPPQRSHRTLLMTRSVAGVDVISSRLVLNVDRAGQVAFMELAWPDIAPDVLERSRRLKAIGEQRYQAPAMEGAKVEAIQPVILHSPAVGFYDDTTVALRVIYQPDAKQVGQKPVRYLDEQGRDVALPRDIDRVDEGVVKRPAPRN